MLDPLHQAHPSMVSTAAVQRTICELVCNLTSEIFSRLEGPQTEFHTKLQSRLEVVLKTGEKHFSDQAHLNADKAVPRTVALHQLILTNAQLTKTWECARDTTHSLSSLLMQPERVVDTLHTPSPVIVSSPPVIYDFSSPQHLPFKRLKTRFPNDFPSVTLDVQRLTQENLLAQQKLLEVQYVSDRAEHALLDATTALNLIQGQAIGEDGEYDIPKAIY
jgi:hypothetical protein